MGTGLKPITTFYDHGNLENIYKASPNDETHDGGNDVHEFRVNIFPDSSSQTTLDVLYQVIILPILFFELLFMSGFILYLQLLMFLVVSCITDSEFKHNHLQHESNTL